MANKILESADLWCARLHVLAWCAAAAAWAFKWWQFGPAPSGPLYYDAEKFIHRLDILVYGMVHEIAALIGQTASAWFSISLGASLVVSLGLLILLAGTLL